MHKKLFCSKANIGPIRHQSKVPKSSEAGGVSITLRCRIAQGWMHLLGGYFRFRLLVETIPWWTSRGRCHLSQSVKYKKHCPAHFSSAPYLFYVGIVHKATEQSKWSVSGSLVHSYVSYSRHRSKLWRDLYADSPGTPGKGCKQPWSYGQDSRLSVAYWAWASEFKLEILT